MYIIIRLVKSIIKKIINIIIIMKKQQHINKFNDNNKEWQFIQSINKLLIILKLEC